MPGAKKHSMSEPREATEDNGDGGSSDGDTQPDDTGATGTLADESPDSEGSGQTG